MGHGVVDVVYRVRLETLVGEPSIFSARLLALGGQIAHFFGCPLMEWIFGTPLSGGTFDHSPQR